MTCVFLNKTALDEVYKNIVQEIVKYNSGSKCSVKDKLLGEGKEELKGIYMDSMGNLLENIFRRSSLTSDKTDVWTYVQECVICL